MVSPLSVEVRDPKVCGDCRTRDCLVGNEVSRGCELDLYLPRKVGSLDCTFCLDCVRACPEDNIGILATGMARETIEEGPRASIGRLAQRPDLAVLAMLLTSAAFVSAAAMTTPFVVWEEQLVAGFRWLSPTVASAALLLLLLFGLPLLLIGMATVASRRLGGMDLAGRAVACSFVFPLVPLGLSMWTAHFLFHFGSGWNSVWPVAIRGLRDFGWELEQPLFILGHASHGMQALGLLLLDAGLLLSLWRIWQCAGRLGGGKQGAEWVAAPWGLVAVLMFLCGVWITFQPMEMRGLLLLAGGPN
jgi:ferredoxin